MPRTLIQLYVPNKEIKERIETAAQKEGRSMSNFLLWLFVQWDKK